MKPNPAVDYFYTAMHRRSRDTTWPILAPALTSDFRHLLMTD